MKKTLATIVGIGLMVSALSVSAVTLDPYSDRFLGFWQPPGNPNDEGINLNVLLPLTQGEVTQGGTTYIRTGNYQPGTALPTAVFAAKDNINTIGDEFDPSASYLYLVAKYGGGGNSGGSDLAWYIGGLTIAEIESIPLTYDGRGLSHMSVFNRAPSVPDGGTTAMLLGVALSGLALLRRKLS